MFGGDVGWVINKGCCGSVFFFEVVVLYIFLLVFCGFMGVVFIDLILGFISIFK